MQGGLKSWDPLWINLKTSSKCRMTCILMEYDGLHIRCAQEELSEKTKQQLENVYHSGSSTRDVREIRGIISCQLTNMYFYCIAFGMFALCGKIHYLQSA